MTFELDRFTWNGETLELSGRWRAESPRRFRHVRLLVDDGKGRSRRIAPASATPMRATPDGESWTATFPWSGEQGPTAPALEAGHDLLVELPAPRRARVPVGSDGSALAAAAAEVAQLRDEVTAVRVELHTVRDELATAQDELAAERRAHAATKGKLTLERKRREAERLQAAEAAAEVVATRLPEPPPPRPVHHYDAFDLPRQPDDHVRGRAPWPVRIVAVTLAAGMCGALALIVSALL